MTIDWIEGFQHEMEGGAYVFPDGTPQPSLWYFGEGTVQTTFPTGRTGLCMHMAQVNGTTTRQIGPILATSSHRHFSFYLRMASNPSVESMIFRWSGAVQPIVGTLYITTAGLIKCVANTTVTGPDVVDNAWHRIDIYSDQSGTTWTTHWRVDGAAQTDCTFSGQTAGAGCDGAQIGESANTGTATFDIDDLISGTAGNTEYPFNGGAVYNIGYIVPDADGTHSNASGYIENEGGGDIGGGNTAYNRLNQWPLNSANYVRQIGVDTDDYAEVEFGATSETNILEAAIVMVGGSATVSGPNGKAYLFDSGNNNILTLYSGNMGGGSTAIRALNTRIPPPGGSWDVSELNGLKARMGYSASCSAANIPRWQEFMIQFVYGAPLSLLPPANLQAVAVSPTQINLSWDDAADATSYDIEEDATEIENSYTGSHTPGSPYQRTGRSPATEYDYRVRSRNAS